MLVFGFALCPDAVSCVSGTSLSPRLMKACLTVHGDVPVCGMGSTQRATRNWCELTHSQQPPIANRVSMNLSRFCQISNYRHAHAAARQDESITGRERHMCRSRSWSDQLGSKKHAQSSIARPHLVDVGAKRTLKVVSSLSVNPHCTSAHLGVLGQAMRESLYRRVSNHGRSLRRCVVSSQRARDKVMRHVVGRSSKRASQKSPNLHACQSGVVSRLQVKLKLMHVHRSVSGKRSPQAHR